jgi:type I restriction-modification system DNA methylase subunit
MSYLFYGLHILLFILSGFDGISPCMLANFPFSMDWDNKIADRNPYNRFRFGIPSEKDKADFAFIQHIFASLSAIDCSSILIILNED